MSQDWSRQRHFVITGASSGIGRALAFALLPQARRLTLVARDGRGRLTETVEQLRGQAGHESARVDAHTLDVRDYDGVFALVQRLYEVERDPVDGFIHSAGGSHHFGRLETLAREDIDLIFDINAKASIYWLRALLPRMAQNPLRDGETKRAHIVMLSSRSGERALPNLAVYAAAKSAVQSLVDAARAEYAARRIVFTTIRPGSIETAFTDNWPGHLRDAHNRESMSVEEAVAPILCALDARYATNHISYESTEQWLGEPGVAADPLE